MDHVQEIKKELLQYADQEKAAFLPKFFKTNPGGYGAGDTFIAYFGAAEPLS